MSEIAMMVSKTCDDLNFDDMVREPNVILYPLSLMRIRVMCERLQVVTNTYSIEACARKMLEMGTRLVLSGLT